MIANIDDRISDRDLLYEAKLGGKIPELMQGILRRKVIDSHIQKAGIELTIADLQAAADKFRIVNQLESAEATKQWLAQRFLSLDDFEDLVTQNTISNKLAEHLFSDRVEQVFYQNILDYSFAIVYEVILEDYDLAMEIYYSLQEGDISFTDVAHQYIPIPELRRRGGYVGKVGRKQLRPELSSVIFAATPPQLLKPIVTAVGIHLIQVEEIVETQLDEGLRQKILGDLFEQWLAEKITAQPEYPQPLIDTTID
jgi:parvulin-like peptidyl-prolyl isomerase